MAGLKIKDEYTGQAAAVSLGLGLMKKCKVNTWNELAAAMAAGSPEIVRVFKTLELGRNQVQLLQDHQGILSVVSLDPPAFPAFCPACGHFTLTSDVKPTKCLVTSDCTGKPYKVTAAVGAKAIPDDDAPDEFVEPEPETEPEQAPEPEHVPEDEPAAQQEPAAPVPESEPEPAPEPPAVPEDDYGFEDIEEGAVFTDEEF